MRSIFVSSFNAYILSPHRNKWTWNWVTDIKLVISENSPNRPVSMAVSLPLHTVIRFTRQINRCNNSNYSMLQLTWTQSFHRVWLILILTRNRTKNISMLRSRLWNRSEHSGQCKEITYIIYVPRTLLSRSHTRVNMHVLTCRTTTLLGHSQAPVKHFSNLFSIYNIFCYLEHFLDTSQTLPEHVFYTCQTLFPYSLHV